MQFTFNGFSEDTGFRVFAFEGVASDQNKTKAKYTVRADLSLIRTYGIRVQELPLLCQGLLERGNEGEQKCSVIFTEGDMRQHARGCAAIREAAIQKRKATRKPVSGQVGSAWRDMQGQGVGFVAKAAILGGAESAVSASAGAALAPNRETVSFPGTIAAAKAAI